MSDIITFPDGALEWLRNGERGASSEAIFEHLTGLPLSGYNSSYPADGSDLRRCRRLLAAVPAFLERFHEMKSVSRQWSILVDHWNELCALQDTETGQPGISSMTYARMCELLDGRTVCR